MLLINMPDNYTPTVLSIAGSDNYAGAGIQIDSKTIHALGGYAFTSITALTAQNSTGVKMVLATPKEIFKAQLESILDDIHIDAVKIGMLANEEIVSIVVDAIERYKLKNIVLDTVLVSSSGKPLLEPSAVETMVKTLFPLVDIITPNIPEVNALLGTHYVGNENDIPMMASALFGLGANAVLIKGGHSTDEQNATEHLIEKSSKIKAYGTLRLTTTHTHGTGCVLSSAIATHLAQDYTLEQSIERSKIFLYQSLKESSSLRFKYYNKENERKEPIF